MTCIIHPQEFSSLVCWDDLTDEQKELFEDQEPDNTQSVELFTHNEQLYSMADISLIINIAHPLYRNGFRGAFDKGNGEGVALRWIDEGCTFFVAEFSGA